MRTATLFYLLTVSALLGQSTPEGYVLPPSTISPDQRFAVRVPKIDAAISYPQDSLIDAKTGKELGIISQENVYFDRMNRGDLQPVLWSADDSMFLWRVDADWGAYAINLVFLENDKLKWQVDIYSALQKEILKRTQAADPKKYNAVKAQNAGDGSWFKDGFTVDAVLVNTNAADSLTFPLQFRIFLTSDPKSTPTTIKVNSRMTATVLKDGTIMVDKFYLGSEPPARLFIRPEQLQGEQQDN